ncbi:MAG: small ribosomal subunit Rsm22 family protein [Simkaniaceae bacterium]|nr:small ribosomal subunit Rsm22 family protein [Candidatus Sacchlamyda saccharinae]
MSRKNYKEVSRKYRSDGQDKQLTASEIESYQVARMPATLAANRAVFEEIAGRIDHPVTSFLDMGAGLGAGLLAAREAFPIEKALLVEKNRHMIAKGKTLVGAEWVARDFLGFEPKEADLVLFSYSLGEISKREEVLKRAWEAAKTLVIIEPGTPTGFSVILGARKRLIEWGGHMVAPCPHIEQCPMEGKDWCHFSVRLERTKEHKLAKGATLGFEDEKYSYVAFSKVEGETCMGRIVRHPLKRSGHVILQICGQEGLVEKTITKKEGAVYKRARKISWGNPFP